MRYTKPLLGISAIGILFTLLILPPQFETEIHADSSDSCVSIGCVNIRTVFHFNQGVEESNSFIVFNQQSGYKINPTVVNSESPKFQLIGGVGANTPLLYHVTDMAFSTQHAGRVPEYNDFDVDIYIGKDGANLHQFSYETCSIDNYKFITLHDGDETFSGLTKFVHADQYDFTCNGYKPYSPGYYESLKPEPIDLKSKSSLDIDSSNIPTWEDHPKFQSVPFGN